MRGLSKIIGEALGAVAKVAGVDVLYYRGSDFTTVCNAIPATANFGVETVDPALIDYQAKDFILEVVRLNVAGQAITPVRGDQIRQTVGRLTYTYEVSRTDASDQVWRYTDDSRRWIRAHTKLKSTVTH